MPHNIVLINPDVLHASIMPTEAEHRNCEAAIQQSIEKGSGHVSMYLLMYLCMHVCPHVCMHSRFSWVWKTDGGESGVIW